MIPKEAKTTMLSLIEGRKLSARSLVHLANCCQIMTASTVTPNTPARKPTKRAIHETRRANASAKRNGEYRISPAFKRLWWASEGLGSSPDPLCASSIQLPSHSISFVGPSTSRSVIYHLKGEGAGCRPLTMTARLHSKRQWGVVLPMAPLKGPVPPVLDG